MKELKFIDGLMTPEQFIERFGETLGITNVRRLSIARKEAGLPKRIAADRTLRYHELDADVIARNIFERQANRRAA